MLPMKHAMTNMDAAGAGSLGPEARRAIDMFLRDWDKRMMLPSWLATYKRAKESFARLIGTEENSVAGVPNVSTAAGMVANALSVGPRSSVVTSDMEFPSNYYPWILCRRRGATVKVAKSRGFRVPLEELERLIDDRTILVTLSHVTYTSGFRHDLEKLCRLSHRLGAFVFVDAHQSAGAIRLDVTESDVDFLATGSSKWLSALPGAGFLYVSPKVIEKLHTFLPGWLGSADPATVDAEEFVEADGARRFETGTPNILGYVAVGAALERLLDFGMERVEERILSLTGWLMEELDGLGFDVVTPRERRLRAGIVSFKGSSDSGVVVSELFERGIKVSHTEAGVRVSIHYTNKEEEIEHLLKSLREICPAG